METDHLSSGDLVARRYRLDHILGSGGTGTVWAAIQVATGRKVALKLLRTRADDPIARKRILREAPAACAVRHPSVVTVHEVIQVEDGSPALVMDRLVGESLRARLNRVRTLSLVEALRIAGTVLEALEVAHAAGIVHQGLKPDNLFFLAGGELKVLDFGVAKLVAADAAPGPLKAPRGTPFYLAPEQALGEAVDGRADLWALGVVLHECLAGERPTRGENLGQLLRFFGTGRIPRLGSRAPDLPRSIAAVIDALLTIDVAQRPASARAVLDALASARREAASNDGEAVRTASARQGGSPAARSAQRAAGFVVVAVLILASIAAVSLTFPRGASRAAAVAGSQSALVRPRPLAPLPSMLATSASATLPATTPSETATPPSIPASAAPSAVASARLQRPPRPRVPVRAPRPKPVIPASTPTSSGLNDPYGVRDAP